MKNLFLIDGASGTGKSDLLRWVVDNNADDVCYVHKGTTRGQRSHEENDPAILLDLKFLDKAEFKSRHYDYAYRYGGAEYGFSRKDINAALLQSDNVFIIVRNNETIRRVCDDYSFVNTVPMLIYTDRAELVERLQRAHASDELIAFRLQRSELALREYYAHPEQYREILINNSSRDVFHGIVDRLLEKYRHHPKIDPYLIAVMMSFNPANRKLEDYYDAMEHAAHSVSAQLKCRRVDKAPGSPKIAAEFRSLISSARCAIVDLTENKQNVYYELGVIQATKKVCVITAEDGTVPSFYPREHKILFYASARELKAKLSIELGALLGNMPILET